MRAILGRWTWDLATGPGRMQQTTEDALRQNAAMLDAVRGRAAGRIQAWPLLLGFGTCSPALIQGAHALAERHGVGLGDDALRLASVAPDGRSRPLAELDALGALTPRTKLAHMVYVDDADIALLARRNVKISHCPTAGLKHIKGLAAHGRFVEMLDAGVCVSLGGDSGNGSNHFDMLRLMYLVATIYKDARLDVGVMPPERALEMATVRGAEALLLDGAIGSIEPGKRADLVLYDLDAPEWRPLLNPLNNLVYAATGASVRTVLIDGRVVLDEGRFTMLDERALYDRAEILARAQVERAGLRIESKWPVRSVRRAPPGAEVRFLRPRPRGPDSAAPRVSLRPSRSPLLHYRPRSDRRFRDGGSDMRIPMRLALAATIAIGAMAPARPSAAQTTLTMSSWVSPQHHLTSVVLQGWATEVEKATSGRVKFTMLPKHPSAPPGHLRRGPRRPGGPLLRHRELHAGAPHPAADGGAARRGRHRARSTRWPTRASTGSTSSKVGEYKGVKLLGGVHPRAGPDVHQEAGRGIDDVQGLKIRTGGGIAEAVAKALGASAFVKPAPESYELLKSGVADGVFFPLESIVSFKLDTVIEQATLFPGGMYSSAFGFFMNEDKWNKLPKQDQDAIDEDLGRAHRAPGRHVLGRRRTRRASTRSRSRASKIVNADAGLRRRGAEALRARSSRTGSRRPAPRAWTRPRSSPSSAPS